MSPSLASWATKAASFFSSSLWKRVFSRQRMSPSFMAATAFAAGSPTQSSANATGFLTTPDSASATGFSESLLSRPLGRPKCASRITLPPWPAISVIVGATRSSRVASVTRPFSMGTLRSTRSSTRLPFTSTSSRVRKDFVIGKISRGSLLSRALRFFPRHSGAMRSIEPGISRFRVWPFGPSRKDGAGLLQQLAHRSGGIGHAIGEPPLIVVPAHHAHEGAVLHLGLVHVEGRRMRVVVEVDRDIGRGGVAENALELLLGGALHRLVDFLH